MKLKILLLIAGISMAGSSITVLMVQSRHPRATFAPQENQLPTAISNYSKTFKLNTTPPIWRQTGTTNGSTKN